MSYFIHMHAHYAYNHLRKYVAAAFHISAPSLDNDDWFIQRVAACFQLANKNFQLSNSVGDKDDDGYMPWVSTNVL